MLIPKFQLIQYMRNPTFCEYELEHITINKKLSTENSSYKKILLLYILSVLAYCISFYNLDTQC